MKYTLFILLFLVSCNTTIKLDPIIRNNIPVVITPIIPKVPTLRSIFEQVAVEYEVSYILLSKIAWLESGHRPNARARTSSARGLFQVVRSTEAWLKTECNIQGDVYDQLTNTRLGACYINWNYAYLSRKLNRTLTDLDLYLAHFLGGGKAVKFLEQEEDTMIDSKKFAREIRSNKPVFLNSDGTLKTYGEVLSFFETKLNNAIVL